MRLYILFIAAAIAAVGVGSYASRSRVIVIRPSAAPAKIPEGIAKRRERPIVKSEAKAEPKAESVPERAVKPMAKVPVAAMPMLAREAPDAPIPVLPSVSVPKEPPEVPIVMASVVVVRCSFENAATGGVITAFGSGAIIDPRGYVLTARHVVDMEYAYRRTGGRQGVSGYALKSCVVGGPDEGTHAPTPAEIRTLNPFVQVGSLPYRADIAFVPKTSAKPGMSESEAGFLDMAIVKIADVTDDAKNFFGRSMPASFPESRLGGGAMPAPGGEIVTFGFPSGTPSYGSVFHLQGSVGAVRDYVGGDTLFKDEPIGILADMETIGGRSGSPVFWKGKVIGVVSAKEDESVRATVISTYPLKELLEGSGIVLPGL